MCALDNHYCLMRIRDQRRDMFWLVCSRLVGISEDYSFIARWSGVVSCRFSFALIFEMIFNVNEGQVCKFA